MASITTVSVPRAARMTAMGALKIGDVLVVAKDSAPNGDTLRSIPHGRTAAARATDVAWRAQGGEGHRAGDTARWWRCRARDLGRLDQDEPRGTRHPGVRREKGCAAPSSAPAPPRRPTIQGARLVVVNAGEIFHHRSFVDFGEAIL